MHTFQMYLNESGGNKAPCFRIQIERKVRLIMKKTKICPNYTGLACIDGSCPIANMEERIERDMDVIRTCKDCHLYKGCDDCYHSENCTLKKATVNCPIIGQKSEV